MIDNVYELIMGIYLGIIVFFVGYYGMGDMKNLIMEGNTLNLVFMTFFIIMFFMFGYLFQNLLLSFKDVEKRNPITYIDTTSSIKNEIKSMPKSK